MVYASNILSTESQTQGLKKIVDPVLTCVGVIWLTLVLLHIGSAISLFSNINTRNRTALRRNRAGEYILSGILFSILNYSKKCLTENA